MKLIKVKIINALMLYQNGNSTNLRDEIIDVVQVSGTTQVTHLYTDGGCVCCCIINEYDYELVPVKDDQTETATEVVGQANAAKVVDDIFKLLSMVDTIKFK